MLYLKLNYYFFKYRQPLLECVHSSKIQVTSEGVQGESFTIIVHGATHWLLQVPSLCCALVSDCPRWSVRVLHGSHAQGSNGCRTHPISRLTSTHHHK
jgi:hypothetical protein